jgi:carbamoyltransferase
LSVVLGINGLPSWHARHDPGAAVVVDGLVLAAVEEERVSRVKRSLGLAPTGAVREVLETSGFQAPDIDVIAYPWTPDAVGDSAAQISEQIHAMLAAAGLPMRAQVIFVEHHLAHAWSTLAFLPDDLWQTWRSPAPPRTTALVLDATGETTSGGAFRFGPGLGVDRLWMLSQASSLGGYYEAASRHIGFGAGEEGKTMGLASYGRADGIDVPPLPDERSTGPLPSRRTHPELHAGSFDELRTQLLQEFAVRSAGPLDFTGRADLAAAAEGFVARRVLAYAQELMEDADVLTFSGGLALNCTINAQLAALCAARGVRLVIPPPANDTGVPLGAALAAAALTGVPSRADAFLGRGLTPEELTARLRQLGLRVESSGPERVAEHLAAGAVGGWFEGRSEIGPRALGRRSVIARAGSAATRDHINVVKGREAWRPLAPSMTAAEFGRSCPGATPSPHMLIAAGVSPAAADRLAGVVHVDGSARVQVVDDAGPYRELVDAMGALTGTAAVTCTSFNRAGEPIVYTPEEAVRSAQAMHLNFLAGDGWSVRLD